MKNENIWCVCNTSYNVDEGKCYRWYSLSLWMSFATSPLFDMCNCISGGNEKLLVPQSPFWLDLRSHSDSRPYSHGSALFSSDCIIYIYEAICTEVNACMQAHDWFSGEKVYLKEFTPNKKYNMLNILSFSWRYPWDTRPLGAKMRIFYCFVFFTVFVFLMVLSWSFRRLGRLVGERAIANLRIFLATTLPLPRCIHPPAAGIT